MQQTVLEAYPKAGLAVLVVWVPMLASDNEAVAEGTSALINDGRAAHFYDGRRTAAAAVAASVGGVGQFAWDTYLFYRPEARWDDGPPPPDLWMHQLGESGWANPARFRWAESLRAELAAGASALLRGA